MAITILQSFMQAEFNSFNMMLFMILLNVLGFLHGRADVLGKVLKLLRLMQHLNIQEREIFKSNQLCGSTIMMHSSYVIAFIDGTPTFINCIFLVKVRKFQDEVR